MFGPWKIDGELATGGFGRILAAHHAETGVAAAVKLLHPRYAASPEMRSRFEREIEILQQVSHPNIVRLLDAGITSDGEPYLCMERLVGETLATTLERTGPLGFGQVLDLCAVVCDALAVTHALGMVHRDINASNIFLCTDGRIVLIDFGIAKRLDAEVHDLTSSHETVGTPSWMSPEQIRGLRVDSRSDIYAIGALLYLVLTGRPPFEDPSTTTVQYLHLHARRPSASDHAAVSSRVDDVLRRAMAIDPRARFADVIALRDAFLAAMRESGQQVAPHTHACGWLLITVARPREAPLHAALIADIEAIQPLAEQWLAAHEASVALDLGSTVIYVVLSDADLPRLAGALHAHLAERPTRHPQVAIGIAIQRGPAVFVRGELHASPMLSLSAWPVPPLFDGVIVVDRNLDRA